MPPLRATIDEDSRLIVTPSHGVHWLAETEEVECVIDVRALGIVRVWSVEAWAADENISPKDAREQIEGEEFEPLSPGSLIGGTFLTKATRKKQGKNPPYVIGLPDMAVFALFSQGEGPMAVRKGKRHGNSGKILLVVFEGFVELWGQAVL